MSKHIFLCGCKTGHKISSEKVEKWTQILKNQNIAHTVIEDMCGTVIKNPDSLQKLKQDEGTVLLGCYPRTMEALLLRAGIRMCCTDIEFYKIDSNSIDSVLSSFESREGIGDVIQYDDEWKSWYPVIDYSRCTGCQKCLNFCLFGVYKTDDFGNVIVDQPANCKDMCPACARTCPETAIIFAKHNESPIDGGDGDLEIQPGENVVEQLQNSDDVYNVLAQRRKAFSTTLLKQDQDKLAEEERACCATGVPQQSQPKPEVEAEKEKECDDDSCCY